MSKQSFFSNFDLLNFLYIIMPNRLSASVSVTYIVLGRSTVKKQSNNSDVTSDPLVQKLEI